MRALLDHLGIESAVIGGHSLGGFLSLRFRVKYPGRVRALVLQGCGPGFRNPEARAKWNEVAEQRARVLEQKGLGTLKGGSEVGVSTQRSAAGLARASRGILAQVDAQVIDSLPGIDVPVLIVAGDGDEPFLMGTNYMASRIPNAVKKIIAAAGHGANVDQPEVFNETLRSFLRQLEGG
jgi:pimeloyl-ACP methyl ester carboxylesterase